jgi:hypothetical protein
MTGSKLPLKFPVASAGEIVRMYGMLAPLRGFDFFVPASRRGGNRVGDFVATLSFFRKAPQPCHDVLGLDAGIKETDGADFAVRQDLVDVELFHRYQDFGVL